MSIQYLESELNESNFGLNCEHEEDFDETYSSIVNGRLGYEGDLNGRKNILSRVNNSFTRLSLYNLKYKRLLWNNFLQNFN